MRLEYCKKPFSINLKSILDKKEIGIIKYFTMKEGSIFVDPEKSFLASGMLDLFFYVPITNPAILKPDQPFYFIVTDQYHTLISERLTNFKKILTIELTTEPITVNINGKDWYSKMRGENCLLFFWIEKNKWGQ